MWIKILDAVLYDPLLLELMWVVEQLELYN